MNGSVVNDENRKLNIFCLVVNNCMNDVRVIKEANTLARQGHNVRVYARLIGDAPDENILDDVVYKRFPTFEDKDYELNDEVLSLFGDDQAFLANELTSVYSKRKNAYSARENMDLTRELILSTRQNKNKHKKIFRLFRRFFDKKYDLTNELRDLNNYKKEYVDGIKEYRERRNNNLFFFRYYQYAYDFLSLDFEISPDVIHAHDLFTLPAAIGLARRCGAKVVFDAHEIEAERAPTDDGGKKKKFILDLEKSLFPEVDEMIAVCDSSSDYHFDLFKKKQPVTIMNSPDLRGRSVDDRQKKPLDSGDIRSSCSLPNGIPLVGYVGAMGTESRGLHKVVEALTYIPNTHLAVVGPRREDHDSWLLKVAEKFSVGDRVHLLDPVPAKDVPQFVATCDVGICPFQDVSLNHRYALPNKLFEMAFAGLPMCVSDLPEMTCFVESLSLGLKMDQTDPESIAKTITRIVKDRKTYLLNDKTRKKLEDFYSWDAQEGKLLELYKSFI
ncbi:glycosyltransferase family 4 protein [Deltaproteobacteria bacterium IMCC39524]|nr:glycosyltransferase family 4 protein [Deltaproteobacteria bacterium IMCC39524]